MDKKSGLFVTIGARQAEIIFPHPDNLIDAYVHRLALLEDKSLRLEAEIDRLNQQIIEMQRDIAYGTGDSSSEQRLGELETQLTTLRLNRSALRIEFI